MSFTKNNYSERQQETLLQIAALSIQHGLKYNKPLAVYSFQYDEALQENRATFVTLKKHTQLRGCIGMLHAIRPLVDDIANNAHAAAFCDPRFASLKTEELDQLDINISVLTPSEPLAVNSEADLLVSLQPGKDGLILKEGRHQATFLPSVWDTLLTAEAFLSELKQKAGLSHDYWSNTIQFERYETLSFSKPVKNLALENAFD